MLQPPPIVLSFAANDPSGGAGLPADILTAASLGCHILPVITAITVQDTAGVEDCMALDSDWITDQARTVLEDMPVQVFKTGLLGSTEMIVAIAEIVSDYPNIPLVMDPVLASGRGDELSNEDMIQAMQELLIPQATVLTPNSIEAHRLINDNDHMFSLEQCAQEFVDMGCENVLITGTHENTAKVVNTLINSSGIVRLDTWERFKQSYHGSGCTLASALAALIARGFSVEESVYCAQEYTWQTINAAFRPGMGQHLPNRLFWGAYDGSSAQAKVQNEGEKE